MTKKKKPSRLQEALIETTRDLVDAGITERSELDKLTMRILGKADAIPSAPHLTSRDIKETRERANVSQAVLAAYLGVTVGYLSRLERGETQPSKPVARLIDIVRRKGLDAIL